MTYIHTSSFYNPCPYHFACMHLILWHIINVLNDLRENCKTVGCRYNTIQYYSVCTHHCRDRGRILITIRTHRIHPISRSNERAMGCLLWRFFKENEKIDRVITAPYCSFITVVYSQQSHDGHLSSNLRRTIDRLHLPPRFYRKVTVVNIYSIPTGTV